MCGILGCAWTNNHSLENDFADFEPLFDRMLDRLAHRGPDDRGTYFGNNIALGHRRLSIIDLTPSGHQPLFNEDGTIAVVCNGEIYNFVSLRESLIEKGHVFRGTSDSEVLVHLYEEHGENCVSLINGMFAFALWDARKRQLLLVRDRFGKKPLVLKKEQNRIFFASELKSLLLLPGLTKEIDPIALDQYLTYQYVPHPRTIFKEFSKLPPGHFAMFDVSSGQLEIKSYWNCDINEEVSNRSFEDWSEELRELVCSAVQLRMQSDVPLGAFLSGGIDSTIVTGLMQQFSTQPIRSFSIGFPQKEYDETTFARIAAQKFGTRHEEFIVTPDAQDILPKLVYHYDEPFSDSSAIPTWYLAELTKKHVTVALSGDAGDELFAGYQRYFAVGLGQWADRLPQWLRDFLAGPLRAMIPSPVHQKSTLRRLKRFLEAFSMPPLERYLQWIAIFNRSRKQELYTDEFAALLVRESEAAHYDMLDFLEHAASRCSKRDPITAITLVDLVTYLPGDLMCKTDIASMGHALECRSPFLDYRVVELAIRMPLEMKIRNKNCFSPKKMVGKYILRETFKDLFPPELLTRGKMGFGVPLDHWFRGPLTEMVQDVLLDFRTINRGYFRPDYVERLIREHQQRQFDHAGRLWSLLFFELWCRRWIDDD